MHYYMAPNQIYQAKEDLKANFDMTSGIGALSTGHSHPRIAKLVYNQ